MLNAGKRWVSSDTGGMPIHGSRAGRHDRVFEVQPRDAAPVNLVHPQRSVQPQMRLRRYSDPCGNPCMRLILPAGRSVLRCDAVTSVPDAAVDTSQQAPQLAPQDLPDDVLIHILPSRFCPPDLLGSKAESQLGATPARCGRVQAICGYVHAHVTFGYGSSNSWTTATLTAADVNVSRLGVGRDFTDLAVSLCRGAGHPRPLRLRLPARHLPTSRRNADGLRRLDASVAGRPVIDLRPAQQPPPQGPHPRRTLPSAPCAGGHGVIASAPSRRSMPGSAIGWCHGTTDRRSSLDLVSWEGHEMADAQPAQRRHPDFLAESRAYFMRAMRPRARRFRILLWIGVLLLPQLILVLLDQR
jgi:hypothetical protein